MARAISMLLGLTCLAGGSYAGYLAWLPSSPPVRPVPPGLYADSPVRDVGEVGQFETVGAEYRIVNHFAHPIRVRDILAGCSCADAQMEPRVLGPSESATLRLAWKTSNRRGPAAEDIRLVYAAEGSEHDYGMIAVRVRGIVVPDFVIEPEVLEFDPSGKGTASVRFKPGRVARVPRLLAAVPSQGVAAQVDPHGAVVHVTFDPAKPGWDASQLKVSVQTDSLREPSVEVPIRVSRGVPTSPQGAF